ncbi:MAG: hypothetical protein IKL68_03470 [Clostridia bacterium]|nr:hypothetical protein [Clostridia bacterium]
MAITATYGPVKLSDEEITFYESAAISYLNHESVPYTSNSNESIRYVQGKNKVTVMSHNIFKETVTTSLENGETFTQVNAPNVNFTGCIIFHTLLGTATLGTTILFMIMAIDEFRLSKKVKAR